MNRARRTKILCQGSKDFRDGLCSYVAERHRVVELESPARGFVMVKMREAARNSLYYMGELLVTEASVLVDGYAGIGIIAGDRESDAYALAVVDAACNGNLPETALWDALFLAEEARIDAMTREGDRRVLGTKVDFRTMDQEAI
jgi:alpha-D-ribose 1-methylphosphonate 5-triphosphate synthase subunit PhnG